MAPYRLQGWDPILIIAQIVCLQSLHYVALSVLIPPLLALLADPKALDYQGGAANIGMIMDWREMAGRPTITGSAQDAIKGWKGFHKGAWSGGKWLSQSGGEGSWAWDGGADPTRGWVIAFAWLAVSGVDSIFAYHLVRKPTHILDFSLTLVFNHLILTTYYAASLPTSLFFWIVVTIGAGITIVSAEHLCVQREMREGLGTLAGQEHDQEQTRDRLLEPAEEGRIIGEHIEMNGMGSLQSRS